MLFLIFSVAEHPCAVELTSVERVEMAGALLPIPNGERNPMRCGLIDVRGKIIPVASLHELLGLPKREIELDDRFINCHFGEEDIALWVDRIEGVHDIDPSQVLPAAGFFTGFQAVDRVIKEKNRLILIWNFSVQEALNVSSK